MYQTITAQLLSSRNPSAFKPIWSNNPTCLPTLLAVKHRNEASTSNYTLAGNPSGDSASFFSMSNVFVLSIMFGLIFVIICLLSSCCLWSKFCGQNSHNRDTSIKPAAGHYSDDDDTVYIPNRQSGKLHYSDVYHRLSGAFSVNHVSRHPPGRQDVGKLGPDLI